MLFNKKKKNPVPHWFEVIQENMKNAMHAGESVFYGYAPVGEEKLLMRLPPNVRFTLDMRVENDNGAEYYYKFIID